MACTSCGHGVRTAQRRTAIPAPSPGQPDGGTGAMVTVRVGDEEEVDRRPDRPDLWRPAGGHDHVARLLRVRRDVDADPELEALLELDAEQAARRGDELALLEPGHRDVAD